MSVYITITVLALGEDERGHYMTTALETSPGLDPEMTMTILQAVLGTYEEEYNG